MGRRHRCRRRQIRSEPQYPQGSCTDRADMPVFAGRGAVRIRIGAGPACSRRSARPRGGAAASPRRHGHPTRPCRGRAAGAGGGGCPAAVTAGAADDKKLRQERRGAKQHDRPLSHLSPPKRLGPRPKKARTCRIGVYTPAARLTPRKPRKMRRNGPIGGRLALVNASHFAENAASWRTTPKRW
jgi:hypothetical protein